MLYATDFSENAERAFEAVSYLRGATREAMLVHVRTPKDPDPADDESVERLSALATQLEEWGIETRTDVRRGDPAEEILAAEAAYEPVTILLGSRGHSRLRRLLLGNVSEDIVANARGNVLLVPPDRNG
jgi:nucleotide-binding universal stress UspA family protein